VSKPTSTRVLLSHTLATKAKRVFVAFLVLLTITSVYSITRAGIPVAEAAAPTTLNFQARLLNTSGSLVNDGTYNVEFKIYNASSSSGSSQGACTGDANCLWTETRTGGAKVQIKNGYLSAYLGDTTALPTNIWNQQLYLTMNIGGTGAASWDGEMTPRIRLTSVPYAFRATVAESAETLSKNTGSNTGTVEFATMTADRKFLFPDTSLATTASPGTICVYNGAASNCPAASGSAYYLQNDTVLQTQTNFHIQARDSGANGTIGGVISGAANGQTVDLLQFRASNDSTVLAAVTAAGNLQVASSVDTRAAGTLGLGTSTATAITLGKSGITTTNAGALTVTELGTFNGGLTAASNFTVTQAGNVAFQRNTTNYTATGTQDDINFGTGVLFRITSASALTITSIAGGVDGRVITLANAGSNAVTINNDAGGTAANRIITGTGANLSVPAGSTVQLAYDSADSRWRVIGGTATTGGGANQQLSNLTSTNINAVLNATANDLTLQTTTSGDIILNSADTIELQDNTNVTGTLTASVAVQAPVLDTATAVALNIGTTNATNITLGHNAGTLAIDQTNFDLSTAGVLTLAGGQTNDITTQANQNLTVQANGTGTIVLNDTVTSAGTLTFSSVATDITTGTNEDLTIDANGTGLLQLSDSVVVAANQYLKLTGGNTASRPGSPTEGMLYYDTETDQLLTYNGTKWLADARDAYLVAASNSSEADKAAADYVADGTADEAEINAALLRADPASGTGGARKSGKVYLFAGTYTTADTISIPNNTTLSGAGKGTLVQFAALGAGISKNMITNTTTGGTGTGITIRDLKLDGNKSGNGTGGTQTGIYIDGAGSSSTNLAGATVTNVLVQNFKTNGIHINAAANNVITNNTVQGSDSYNIYTNNANHDFITGNTITGATLNGIYLTASVREIVSNNYVGSNANYGIRIDTGNTNTIIGNILSNNTGSGSTSTVYLVSSDTNLITGNSIVDSAGSGYAIDISDAGSDGNYFANNTFSGTGATTVNDVGTGTIFANQIKDSSNGNVYIQPAGTVELMKNTNVTGTLNVTSNVDTNGSLTVGNANQFVVSNTGVVTSGTWNGTAVADTYVADTLTVDSSSTVDWQALNNYPAACAAGQAITQLGDSITCSAFATGTGNDIQNQFASAQTSADFWISGTGRADTELQAPTFDTATAVALTLGGDATSISVVDDVTIAAGKSLTVTGGVTGTRPASPTEGMIYFDTTTKQLLTYANGKWQADRTESVIVAASNSTQADKDAADYLADGNTGAAGDGDQVQINAALTAATGKKVVLLAGTYTVDAAIAVPTNTTLTGVGPGSVVTIPNSFNTTINIIGVAGTDTVVENLMVDQNTANQTSGTIVGISSIGSNNTVKHTKHINVRSTGIDMTAGAEATSGMVRNNFVDCTNGDPGASSTAVGISVTGSTSNNMTITTAQGNGINNCGTGILAASRVVIADNTVTAARTTGMSLQSVVGATITGNNVAALYGNFSNNYGTTVLLGSTVSYSSITGNTFRYGQTVVNLTTITDSVFSGNTMTDSNGTMLSFTTGSGNTISNNTSRDISENQNGWSFDITNSVIGSNKMSRLYLYSTAHYNQVSANQINGTGVTVTNILDVNGDNTTVTDNVFHGVGSGYIALKLAATADSTYLADNRIVNSSGATFLSDTGTNTVYGGQTNDSTNFVIQPAGTVELMKNTNITGTLNVTGNVDTNGSLTVGNADQFVISNLGVVTAGTWQGTAITDTYVADTLTVDSSSSVHWQALNNYPAACAAGQAITQLGDSITCSAFATGTGNDIQNQFASAQTSADFWISGTGRADTALQAPTFDTATAATLTLGGTATSISVVDDVTIAAGKSLTVTGGNTGSRPVGTEGMVYYDTTTKQLLTYANGKWQADRTDAILVAASNSAQADKDAADYVADGNTGAAADGDQVQINAALTAATGKKVVLLAGTYVADATILIPNNTALVGVGKGTLVELADLDTTDNLIENSDTSAGTGITIRDMRIDGRNDLNTAGTQRGIVLDTMGGGTGSSARQGALVTGVTVTRFRSENILFSNSSNNIVANITSQASTSDGMQLGTGSSNNTITGSKFQGNTGNGYLSNGSSNGNTLSGNHAQGNGSSGFNVANGSYNTLSGNTSNGNQNGFSIGNIGTSNTISTNTAQGNSSAGFNVTGLGNTFTGNATNGGTNGFNVSGANNTVSGNTVQAATQGILLSADHINVSGNTINASTTYGVYLNGANSGSISGNKVYDTGGATTNNGIYIVSSDSNSITSNFISDTSATTNNYAVNVFNATSDTNYIAGNTLGGGSVNDSGTGTTYGGQVNSSGNFVIQPASGSTIELMRNTNVTGTLNVTSDFDTNGSLTVGNANQFVISNTGVVTSGTWNGSAIGLAYGGTNNNSYTTNGVVYGNGTALVSTGAGTTGQCLLATTSAAPSWGSCTSTDLQGAYTASATVSNAAEITLADAKGIRIIAQDTTTDPSIIMKLNCTGCGTGTTGNFLVQNNSSNALFSVAGNGTIEIGTANNGISLSGSGGTTTGSFTLKGTARNTKKIRLHAEYPSVVLTPDGSNNTGTMTSGYDNTSSARMNYYNWTTTQGTNQDYDIVVQIPLPTDFDGWASNPLSITGYTTDTTNGTISLEARDSADSQICNFVAVTPGSTNTWTANTTGCTLSTGTYTAGDYITLRIRLQAPTSGNTRVGNIVLTYNSKF
jgi:parallel beta-helix repeat protein